MKKASLELSINAIVILILAITILGLGLGFVKGQWFKLDKSLNQQQAGMQKMIEDEITNSGDILVFSTLKVEAKKGKTTDWYFGIKNTASEERCFTVQIKCIQGKTCNDWTDGDYVVGGFNLGTDTTKKWFTEPFPGTNIPGTEVKVLPISLQTTAEPGTYEMEIIVQQSDTPETYNPSIPTAPCGSGMSDYIKKTFYITIQS